MEEAVEKALYVPMYIGHGTSWLEIYLINIQ